MKPLYGDIVFSRRAEKHTNSSGILVDILCIRVCTHDCFKEIITPSLTFSASIMNVVMARSLLVFA